MRTAKSVDDLQMRELQDQLEAEQYFSTLYKTQVNELKEEVDEKTKQVQHQRIRLKKKTKKNIRRLTMI